MVFLKFNNANIAFGKKTLTGKTYIINKALFITKQVQIIDKKIFIIIVLDAHNKRFVTHIAI